MLLYQEIKKDVPNVQKPLEEAKKDSQHQDIEVPKLKQNRHDLYNYNKHQIDTKKSAETSKRNESKREQQVEPLESQRVMRKERDDLLQRISRMRMDSSGSYPDIVACTR